MPNYCKKLRLNEKDWLNEYSNKNNFFHFNWNVSRHFLVDEGIFNAQNKLSYLGGGKKNNNKEKSLVMPKHGHTVVRRSDGGAWCTVKDKNECMNNCLRDSWHVLTDTILGTKLEC